MKAGRSRSLSRNLLPLLFTLLFPVACDASPQPLSRSDSGKNGPAPTLTDQRLAAIGDRLREAPSARVRLSYRSGPSSKGKGRFRYREKRTDSTLELTFPKNGKGRVAYRENRSDSSLELIFPGKEKKSQTVLLKSVGKRLFISTAYEMKNKAKPWYVPLPLFHFADFFLMLHVMVEPNTIFWFTESGGTFLHQRTEVIGSQRAHVYSATAQIRTLAEHAPSPQDSALRFFRKRGPRPDYVRFAVWVGPNDSLLKQALTLHLGGDRQPELVGEYIKWNTDKTPISPPPADKIGKLGKFPVR